MICMQKLCHFTVANLVLTATRQRSGKTGICDRNMIQFMPANHSNTNRVITILIHSDNFFFCFFFFMVLMPKIFDVTANENARYKRNEFECLLQRLLSIENYQPSGYVPCIYPCIYSPVQIHSNLHSMYSITRCSLQPYYFYNIDLLLLIISVNISRATNSYNYWRYTIVPWRQ